MNPFGDLGSDLSPSELRETAYEILVGSCRSSGAGRPLTYVSSKSLQRTVSRSSSSPAASQLKKALGLKQKVKNEKESSENRSTGELMRIQMRVSDQADSRIRRGLLRVAADQLGRRMESMILPLELLQHLKPSDFPSQQAYILWQERIFKILESGLLVHPHLPLDKLQTAPRRLQKLLQSAREKKNFDSGKNSEQMQLLRSVVTSLSCRSFDDSSSDFCHWADGIPLNLHLYQMLLEASFDVDEEASVIDEIDEVLELIKKTWGVLGMNKALHNLCFMWLLLNRYITSGEIEKDLLFAANHMMGEVEKDAKETRDPSYSKILNSTSKLILDWAENILFRYHDVFYRDNIDVMRGVLSLGLSAAKLLAVDRNKKESDVACGKIDAYIRSSVRSAFSQEKAKLLSIRQSSKHPQNPLPFLSILSQNTYDMAFNEKEIYSPLLKKWHALPTGVAVATLHSCYARELKQFVSSISELNPEAIQVLLSADKLEKDLVEMAVEDSVDSDDGGKSIIQEMEPYEAEGVIVKLVESWIETRVERLDEWVERNLQQEDWNPQTNKGLFAQSAVEVLRIVDETLEAFFLLPIPMHPILLPELITGLDKCLQNYVLKAKSGCGSRATFVPALPAPTRCTSSSKFGSFMRKDRSLVGPGRKSKVFDRNGENSHSFTIPQLCSRINTNYTIRKELESLEKKLTSNLKNSGFFLDQNVSENCKFKLSLISCTEGIQQLSESIAYKIVFHNLSHVLSDYLYMGDTSSSKIEPFLDELEKNLEIISVTVHERVRTRVITDLLRASLDGFLLVLLGGGPARAFTLQDSLTFEQDFKFLTDLFWSNGDGLPLDLIDKLSATVKSVLPLFRIDTENLIEQLKRVSVDGRSKISLPSTTGQWGPNEPNTILRVLCNRNDKLASKFLKKTYGLPKRT